nr:integrase, catalytic region, zinc finger, CCHC-type, peptidase aspartic, catalytic [Tanacetum cinerariifolium]
RFRQKSGDRHQPTSQQSSHRSHGHHNDRHESYRRGGSNNHRSSNNNYSGSNNRNSGYGRDQRNRGHQSNRSANFVFLITYIPGSSGLQRFFHCAMFIYSFLMLFPCLYIRLLSVMLSRISFHVLYDRSFKSLCLLKYALMKRHDYDITVFFTKRGVTIMVSEPGFETVGSKDLTCEDWMVNTCTDTDLSAAVQNALQTLLPQIRTEIREEFRTKRFADIASPDSQRDSRGVPYQFWTMNTETSTEFMQRFLRLAGFLGAAAGTEEEQAKNIQWGLRSVSSDLLGSSEQLLVLRKSRQRTSSRVFAEGRYIQKEESRNIDRELAFEKQIKELNNIIFKRNQSPQTVYMLTKPWFFYDHTTKQALDFQNPFYLKKAQQLEPKLYDGSVIQKTNAIVIRDSEETLMLAEESRSKMLLINFHKILKHDLPTQVEVPKELPKVSMVITSLKKLKHHLASFDVVVKERTTATAIIEGTWVFEHTKACFRDEIIPFVKALKDLFNPFGQFLIDELSEVQNVFYQMEQAVEQHRVESKGFQVKMNKVLNENERLLEQAIGKDIVNIVVTSTMNNAYEHVHECERCVKLETELQKDFIKRERIKKLKERIKSLSENIKEEKINKELKEIETINIDLDHRVTKLIAENEHLKQTYKQLYDAIKSSRIRSKEQCDNLIKQVKIKSAENSDLNARIQEKVLVITALKDTLSKIKGKVVIDEAVIIHPIDPKLLKINVAQLDPKLRNNKTSHYDYLKHTQEETTTLREIVKHERSLNPLNTSLDYACKYTKRIQELLIILKQTCLCIHDIGVTLPTSASGSQPSGNTKKDKIQQTPSSAKKNKLEAYPRNVRTSLQNKKSVVNTKNITSIQESKLNVNSDLQCVTCNGCLFSDNHDSCVLEFINSVNARVKSKSAKKPLKRKVVQIVLWYLDSGCSKQMTEDRSQLTNFVNKFLGTVKFGNDHVAKIMGYGDYKIENVTISRVYLVEGLGYNLFSVGQFCDSNLEVAFRQHTCFIRNLKGVDLLTGS